MILLKLDAPSAEAVLANWRGDVRAAVASQLSVSR
jgi:hypothetical protein